MTHPSKNAHVRSVLFTGPTVFSPLPASEDAQCGCYQMGTASCEATHAGRVLCRPLCRSSLQPKLASPLAPTPCQ